MDRRDDGVDDERDITPETWVNAEWDFDHHPQWDDMVDQMELVDDDPDLDPSDPWEDDV